MKFSVIIPAHNEEDFIGACLESIKAASAPYPGQVEVCVCLNRCTDGTEAIAQAYGCKTIHSEDRNVARVRNAAAGLATGEFLVTIDADSTMSENMLTEIDKRLSSGRYIGGGVLIKPERVSPGIIASSFWLLPLLLWQGISGGLFWCRRTDFEAIGGFDDSFVTIEDIDFAKRLKRHGRQQGKRFGTITKAHIITSCRKFDIYGDWITYKNPRMVWRIMTGKDRGAADWYIHDARNKK